MDIRKDQGSTPAMTVSLLSNDSRVASCALDVEYSGGMARAVGGAQLLMRRRLAAGGASLAWP